MISKSLFPLNQGSGFSTGYELKCDWCGTIHNSGMDADEDTDEGDSVMYFDFGPLTIADCCFDDFERVILVWSTEIVEFIEIAAVARQKNARSQKKLARRGAKAFEKL